MVMVYPITPQSQFKNNSRATVPLTTSLPKKNPLIAHFVHLFPRKVKHKAHFCPIYIKLSNSTVHRNRTTQNRYFLQKQ